MPSSILADDIARALLAANVKVATHVPGFGASTCFRSLNAQPGAPAFPLSLHEEVAFGVAHGAALSGQRAVTMIKAHGLAKAANAVLAAHSSGTTAGLLSLVFDDPRGSHSDNILATERLLDGLELDWRRAGADAAQAVADAFLRSERNGLPTTLLLDADACELPSSGGAAPSRLPDPPPYRRDAVRHLVCPLFASYQREIFTARFAGRSLEAIPRPRLPRIPDDLPPPWQPTLRTYSPFFDRFHRRPRGFTGGDTGLSSLFALPPYECVDAVTYMGGSTALALGALLGGCKSAWAVTGDFAFIAAGHLGLLEAAHRHVPLKVVILHNSVSKATGGQALPSGALETLLHGYETRVQWLDDASPPAAIDAALESMERSSQLSVLVVRVRE